MNRKMRIEQKAKRAFRRMVMESDIWSQVSEFVINSEFKKSQPVRQRTMDNICEITDKVVEDITRNYSARLVKSRKA